MTMEVSLHLLKVISISVGWFKRDTLQWHSDTAEIYFMGRKEWATVSSWFPEDVPVDFPMHLIDTPWLFHHFPVIVLWCSIIFHDFAMNFPWFSHNCSMIFPWFFLWSSLIFPCFCHDCPCCSHVSWWKLDSSWKVGLCARFHSGGARDLMPFLRDVEDWWSNGKP